MHHTTYLQLHVVLAAVSEPHKKVEPQKIYDIRSRLVIV